MYSAEIEAALELLNSHPDFQVHQRIIPLESYGELASGEKIKRLAIVDTETTGTDYESDKLMEIGGLMVEFDSATGQLGKVVERLSMLQDPGVEIPEEVQILTGITPDMVKGKKFDIEEANRFFASADLVCAHNSGFDRKFLEPDFPVLVSKPWACSLAQVPWKQLGVPMAKLEYLLYVFKVFFEGHRAVNDCEATLHLLAQLAPGTEDTVFKTMLATARKPTFKVAAVRSPFETKDILKKRGYQWNADAKVWQTFVLEDVLEEEMAFLAEEVYSTETHPARADKISFYDRFSIRE